MERICPMCLKRISEWMMAGGKCEFIDNILVHTACLKDKAHENPKN